MDKNQLILGIIDALIWPLTFVGFVIFYRKVVKQKLLGLKSAKVSADGGEFMFEEIQQELKNSTERIESRTGGKENVSQSSEIKGRGTEPKGRGTEPKGRGTEPKGRSVSESTDVVKPALINSNLSPYKQLFMINSKVEEYLKRMAKKNNISTDDFESLTMIDKLTQKGVIDLSKRDKLVKITKLVRTVDSNITQDQIDVLRKYYQII